MTKLTLYCGRNTKDDSTGIFIMMITYKPVTFLVRLLPYSALVLRGTGRTSSFHIII